MEETSLYKRTSLFDEDYTLFKENWKEKHSPVKVKQNHNNNEEFFLKKRESLSFYDSKTYFLKGTDPRKLNDNQILDLVEFVNTDQKGQSFLVYNRAELLRKINTWKEKLPWIRPFYAIKSNPIEYLVKDVMENGGGLDVASQGEIKQGLQNGVHPHDMIFSNPVKEEKDIAFAASHGVLYTTADTFDELVKIKKIAPNMKILWRISITEDPNVKLATTFSNKFGDDININNLDEIKAKFLYIKKQLGIDLHGIHFHCGSGQDGASTFIIAVKTAKECIRIAKEYGHPMEILDLGGGFPAGDLSDKFIEQLQITKDESLGFKVVAEPGRHFSSQSCYLFARVLAKRIKKGKTCFHINDSLYHSFNCILMDGISFEGQNDQFYRCANNSTKQIQDVNQIQFEEGSIFGMTCDGLDIIVKNFQFPSDIQVHDWICFGGFGSYTFGPKSSFNGMESTTRVFEWEANINHQ